MTLFLRYFQLQISQFSTLNILKKRELLNSPCELLVSIMSRVKPGTTLSTINVNAVNLQQTDL